MPPRQPYQPQSQPQRSPTSVLPQYGYDAIPGQSQRPQHFQQPSQQHPNGQYEVVPAPQQGPNDGHSGHNPYEFIVNPDTVKRPGLSLNLMGSFSLIRVVLLAGGVVIALIIAAIIISALAPKGSTPGLISIAQRQQEIGRVATEAAQDTSNQDATNFVTNVEASITSSQQQVTSYLASHGTKLGNKTLTLDQSSQTDSQLATAASANDYDNAVTAYMIGQLQTYESLLQTTYGQTSSTAARALLQNSYDSANLLLKQAKALQQELDG